MKLLYSIIFLLIFTACNTVPPSQKSSVDRKEIGQLVSEGIPEIPEAIKKQTHLYQQSRPVNLSGWDRSGRGLFVVARAGETDQIHHLPEPGATFTQVTTFKEPVRIASLSPDTSLNGFLFTKDAGGNEFSQIFWYSLGTKKINMLSDGEAVNGSISWSNSGRRFAFRSTRRNGTDFDVYVSEIESPSKAMRVVEKGGGGMWMPMDWSPDDSKILIKNYISRTESYLYILSLGSGDLEKINPSDPSTSYGSAHWDANGKGIYYTSDKGSEFIGLWYMDLETREQTPLCESIPWDVERTRLSKDRKNLVFSINENGISKLNVLNTETQSYLPISNLPQGLIGNMKFHPGGKKLAVSINSAQSPGEVFVLDLETNDIQKWTTNTIEGLDLNKFVQPQAFQYPTFDQVEGKPRMIPAFIYKPKNVQGKMPVVITIHGGPEGQFRPRFSWLIQYLVNEMGIVVIAPNVRGSAGYGKSYLKLDNGYKRESSVKDIGSLLEWVGTQPDLDPFHVAVSGGSYGGYMVLASMVAYDDRLKCGVDRVGISNFVTFLENTQSYRRDLRRVEYGDERIPEMRDFLHKISPTTHADKITNPLFVIQGLNDPRVPASESEQMVEVIRTNGGEVWYLLAKDEGHGFRKRSNSDFATNATILFYQENLVK